MMLVQVRWGSHGPGGADLGALASATRWYTLPHASLISSASSRLSKYVLFWALRTRTNSWPLSQQPASYHAVSLLATVSRLVLQNSFSSRDQAAEQRGHRTAANGRLRPAGRLRWRLHVRVDRRSRLRKGS